MDSPTAVAQREWDYVIVGTGMGGATLGHALAQGGQRVLFLEKGTSPRKAAMLRGHSPEESLPPGPLTSEHRDALRLAGRAYDVWSDRTRGAGSPFFPLLGFGVGGSSALYGAILERFQPLDFVPRDAHPKATDSTIPRVWPVSFEEMVPYYERAEALYGVQPARLGHAARTLSGKLAAHNVHPYPLPTATRFVEGCRNCQGMLCARQCKIDSYEACLAPALTHATSALVEDCEVLGVSADAQRVRDVRCRVGGDEMRFTAKTIVLAAGAMETPRLLLNSTNPQWPRGLANGSQTVGLNLMRHLLDLYVINEDVGPPTWGKELGINDLYATPSGKYGAIHGMGPLPVHTALKDQERTPLLRYAGIVTRPLVKAVLRRFAARFNFASFLEDLPYAENRVLAGPDRTFQYRIAPYDRDRLKAFRHEIGRVLGVFRKTALKQAHFNSLLFHCCGTCRFGTDPATSVLDKNNRAHELENLYVVDASFMPTSGGTAPSLTIAANALRVADHLLAAGSRSPAGA